MNQCRYLSCGTVVCKHFASYQGYPHYRWDLVGYTKGYIDFLFIFSGCAAERRLWPPRPRGFSIIHNDAPQSVGLLWTSDQLVAETSTWQHTTQTNVHALGGIRTHDHSRRAAVHLRLRPSGHWDWQFYCLHDVNSLGHLQAPHSNNWCKDVTSHNHVIKLLYKDVVYIKTAQIHTTSALVQIRQKTVCVRET
jgi:hypothetical protein